MEEGRARHGGNRRRAQLSDKQEDMPIMSEPYTGGCACGAIRYTVAGEPLVMNDCQCRDCQQESGTGHGSHVIFQGAEVALTGSATLWTRTGAGGTAKARAFCPTCGAPVYMTFPDMPDIFLVSAASLDDPGRYRPQIVTWTASAQPWDMVAPDIPHFTQMPPR